MSKIEEILLRNNNTKYFQTKSKIRRSRNRILKIKSQDGITYTTHGEISKQIIDDLKIRFKKNNNCQFNEEMAFHCIKNISNK